MSGTVSVYGLDISTSLKVGTQMMLNNLIHLQPRCTSSYLTYSAFCCQTPTSNVLVLCEFLNSILEIKNIDIYEEGLAEVKFITIQQPLLVILTETTVKGYQLDGKLVVNYHRHSDLDLADETDRFVSVAVHNNSLTLLSSTGNIHLLKDNTIHLLTSLNTPCILIKNIKNSLLISTQDSHILTLSDSTTKSSMKVPSKLPVYFVEECGGMVVMGAVSGEIMIAQMKELEGMEMVCRLQAHTGLMTCMQVWENSIVTGGDDGFVNWFQLNEGGKMSLRVSRDMEKIVTGVFRKGKEMLASVYESLELVAV